MRRYVQCCDSTYAPQGLALLRSLIRHEPDPMKWEMTWVCMDDGIYSDLKAICLKDRAVERVLRPRRWADMEHDTPWLIDCLYDGRTMTEWFWTQASQAVYWRLRAPETRPGDLVVYLDSDLYFMADPSPVFGEIPTEADIALHTHRFHPDYADREARGRFNVGLCAFRATQPAREAACWWAQRVREIGGCRVEMPELRWPFRPGSEWVRSAGSAGDQGWVEALPRIARVHEWNRPDIAIAPYSYDWNDLPETIRWAHFHEYRFDWDGNCVRRTGYQTSAETERRIVEPWLAAVKSAAQEREAIRVGKVPA